MTKRNLPKISIITPSYNQGAFIEKTINSVLSQKYENYEYIIIDGESTDDTIKILKKYQKYITWKSEKDRGQSHAINKGLKQTTGDIVGFINADDLYLPNAFKTVSECFERENDVMWLTGGCKIINEKNEDIRSEVMIWKNFWIRIAALFRIQQQLLLILNYISQPSTFWRRSGLAEVGYFNENLNYTMDYDYWLRLVKKYPPSLTNELLAAFRVHKESKGSKYFNKQLEEGLSVVKKYTRSQAILSLHRLHDIGTMTLYNIIKKNE